MGAPYLILCSESDELASYQVICNFTQRLQELGGDIKLVTMSGSPHVGLSEITMLCNHDCILVMPCREHKYLGDELNETKKC